VPLAVVNGKSLADLAIQVGACVWPCACACRRSAQPRRGFPGPPPTRCSTSVLRVLCCAVRAALGACPRGARQVAQHGYAPSMEDLLVCLTNIAEVAHLLKQPGRCGS
jgi:hypothetical protein